MKGFIEVIPKGAIQLYFYFIFGRIPAINIAFTTIGFPMITDA